MCSQKSDAPMALDARTKKIYFGGKTPGDPYLFVPQTTYGDSTQQTTETAVSSSNPYDIKDELFDVFQEKERLDQERRMKNEPPAQPIINKSHALHHSDQFKNEKPAEVVVQAPASVDTSLPPLLTGPVK